MFGDHFGWFLDNEANSTQSCGPCKGFKMMPLKSTVLVHGKHSVQINIFLYAVPEPLELLYASLFIAYRHLGRQQLLSSMKRFLSFLGAISLALYQEQEKRNLQLKAPGSLLKHQELDENIGFPTFLWAPLISFSRSCQNKSLG